MFLKKRVFYISEGIGKEMIGFFKQNLFLFLVDITPTKKSEKNSSKSRLLIINAKVHLFFCISFYHQPLKNT